MKEADTARLSVFLTRFCNVGAEIRYSADVEDCNVKSNERKLGECAGDVISASYRGKNEGVVIYN